jgi:hypothetical protein
MFHRTSLAHTVQYSEQRERMAPEQVVVVSAQCPFCGGSIPLFHERVDVTSVVDIAKRFAGEAVVCMHPRCERTFTVRRADLTIRRRRVRS